MHAQPKNHEKERNGSDGKEKLKSNNPSERMNNLLHPLARIPIDRGLDESYENRHRTRTLITEKKINVTHHIRHTQTMLAHSKLNDYGILIIQRPRIKTSLLGTMIQ